MTNTESVQKEHLPVIFLSNREKKQENRAQDLLSVDVSAQNYITYRAKFKISCEPLANLFALFLYVHCQGLTRYS